MELSEQKLKNRDTLFWKMSSESTTEYSSTEQSENETDFTQGTQKSSRGEQSTQNSTSTQNTSQKPFFRRLTQRIKNRDDKFYSFLKKIRKIRSSPNYRTRFEINSYTFGVEY